MSLSLAFITQQLVIYIGIFIFVAGIISAPLVLLVFLSLETFRQSSYAFYLTMMSFVNISHLFTGLLTFIMINGFGINWINLSLFYCKFRQYYIPLITSISLTCMCLATIDQFLATCSNPRWHRWNNIKFARCLVIVIVFIWILYAIPFLLYSDLILSPTTNTYTCVITNLIFQQYILYQWSIVLSIFPGVIMILFGVLAYRNVQQIAYRTIPLVRRELDKQLTTMVLVQVFYDIIAIIPTAIFYTYSIIVPSADMILLNSFKTVVALIYYAQFVSSFYIYICVSKRFRQQLIHVLFTIHLRRWHGRGQMNAQVHPQT